MPSPYVHKKRGKTMKYSVKDLQKAVDAVNQGMKIREAAEIYSVPKSTIGDRISGKHDLQVGHGRPPAMPQEVEQKIVTTVKKAASLGMGLSRKQILLRSSVLCNRLKIKTSYDKFHAGKDWWAGLKRRYPELVTRKPEKLTTIRARMLNREVVGKYFDDLESIINNLNLSEKPYAIWNCDESGLNFEHSPVRVVAEKGDRNVTSRTSCRSSNITIMACVNASGRRMPPLVIAKGKTHRSLSGFNTNEAPEGTMWTYQEKGWMTDVIGELWFNDVFLKHCGPERPQLLILDGHSSHESLAILERAIEENISIMSLPPHCTHALQPLDKSVFGPFKTAYNGACSDFLTENPLHQITKWTFPTLFKQAWDTALSPSNIINGFRSCGIVPVNKSIIPDAAYLPSVPTDLPEPLEEEQPETETGRGEPILDIANPEQLFQLIGSGDFLVEDLNIQIPPIDPLNQPKEECQDEEVASVFLPKVERPRAKRALGNRKKCTTHKLLTSPDILAEKKLRSDLKAAKLNKTT